jgi:hypothetical protein
MKRSVAQQLIRLLGCLGLGPISESGVSPVGCPPLSARLALVMVSAKALSGLQ